MIREGELVWVIDPVGKLRPAFVICLATNGTHALVLSGTGTAGRDVPHAMVDPERRANKSLRFSKKTYFYADNVHVRRLDELQASSPPVRCPNVLWLELRPLAQAGAASRLSANDFREWWPPEDEASSAGETPPK